MKFKANFQKYLIDDVGVSSKSLKFYSSDFNSFSGWLFLKAQGHGILSSSFKDAVSVITRNTPGEYKEFLLERNASKKTVNRKLSTLRHLARYLHKSKFLTFNFMVGTTNLEKKESYKKYPPAVGEFENFLYKSKHTKNTIRNYTNDVKQFLKWIEKYQQN